MPLVSTSWARRGSLLAEEPPLEPHKHIHRCVSMRSDRPTEPTPPRWMKTEKSGKQPRGKSPHHYCGVSLRSWAWVRARLTGKRGKQERSTGRFILKALNYSPLPLCSRSHRTDNTGMLWPKTKKRRGEEKNKSRETESERSRDFFSWMKHVVGIAAST